MRRPLPQVDARLPRPLTCIAPALRLALAMTLQVRSGGGRAIVPSCSRRHAMKKIYDPPLTKNQNAPLYRIDKAIEKAQERLLAAIDMKRHHTSQNLAQEVVKEAREALRKADHVRELKIKELAQKDADSRAYRK